MWTRAYSIYFLIQTGLILSDWWLQPEECRYELGCVVVGLHRLPKKRVLYKKWSSCHGFRTGTYCFHMKWLSNDASVIRYVSRKVSVFHNRIQTQNWWSYIKTVSIFVLYHFVFVVAIYLTHSHSFTSRIHSSFHSFNQSINLSIELSCVVKVMSAVVRPIRPNETQFFYFSIFIKNYHLIHEHSKADFKLDIHM